MRAMKYIYTCDFCGNQQEFASAHDFPMVHVEVELRWKANLHFCDTECQDKWLVAHNFEVKE